MPKTTKSRATDKSSDLVDFSQEENDLGLMSPTSSSQEQPVDGSTENMFADCQAGIENFQRLLAELQKSTATSGEMPAANFIPVKQQAQRASRLFISALNKTLRDMYELDHSTPVSDDCLTSVVRNATVAAEKISLGTVEALETFHTIVVEMETQYKQKSADIVAQFDTSFLTVDEALKLKERLRELELENARLCRTLKRERSLPEHLQETLADSTQASSEQASGTFAFLGWPSGKGAGKERNVVEEVDERLVEGGTSNDSEQDKVSQTSLSVRQDIENQQIASSPDTDKPDTDDHLQPVERLSAIDLQVKIDNLCEDPMFETGKVESIPKTRPVARGVEGISSSDNDIQPPAATTRQSHDLHPTLMSLADSPSWSFVRLWFFLLECTFGIITITTYISCLRERQRWLWANGLTRSYLLGVMHHDSSWMVLPGVDPTLSPGILDLLHIFTYTRQTFLMWGRSVVGII